MASSLFEQISDYEYSSESEDLCKDIEFKPITVEEYNELIKEARKKKQREYMKIYNAREDVKEKRREYMRNYSKNDKYKVYRKTVEATEERKQYKKNYYKKKRQENNI